MRTGFCREVEIAFPIVQAPMAGGGSTVELVAAVSEAGGLGSLGAAYLTPEAIRSSCEAVRARTRKPFAVNLFVPLPEPDAVDTSAARARLHAYHDELGIAPPMAAEPWSQQQRFDAQLDAVVASKPAVFSFTFGIPAGDALERVRRAGILIVGTATTVEEAIGLERAGADAIVAQGAEAGGHRGTFTVPFERALIGTMALVPAIVDAVRVAVIASGGIMDGRGIAAALALGAQAAALGTAFLTTPEAGVSDAHKRALREAHEDDTAITLAFSGRAARGIRNRVMDEFEGDASSIAPYPVQNDLTRAMRTAAAAAGKPEYLSLWSGQGVRLARQLPASELVGALIEETRSTIAAMSSFG